MFAVAEARQCCVETEEVQTARSRRALFDAAHRRDVSSEWIAALDRSGLPATRIPRRRLESPHRPRQRLENHRPSVQIIHRPYSTTPTSMDDMRCRFATEGLCGSAPTQRNLTPRTSTTTPGSATAEGCYEVEAGPRNSGRSSRRRRCIRSSYVNTPASSSPSVSADGRWIASSVRSSTGVNVEAVVPMSSVSGISAAAASTPSTAQSSAIAVSASARARGRRVSARSR